MRFDLFTLYLLAVGTLVLSGALTYWESRARLQRRTELRLLTASYMLLATGCTIGGLRGLLPGFTGAAMGNLVIVSGYLLLLNAVALFDRRDYARLSVALFLGLALGWLLGGAAHENALWSYIGNIPIVIAGALTVVEVLRCEALRPLRARRLVVLVLSTHGLFYAGRVLILPMLVAWFGTGMLEVIGMVTMYEGVLYSVGLPMALLSMIREEAHRQLLESSSTDFLTGVGNRRWFFDQGERLLRARDGQGGAAPVSLLAFDLDHFKAINDQHGHAAGDAVLQIFADTARATLGPDAAVARIGGEEFVALLPGFGHGVARDLGRVLAARFAAAVPQDARTPGVAATVSIGVAEQEAGQGAGAASLGELLSAADRALYLAKARGRNRIETAAPAAPAPLVLAPLSPPEPTLVIAG
jgi:diguanylate cyclase (GGDEF)-like protein